MYQLSNGLIMLLAINICGSINMRKYIYILIYPITTLGVGTVVRNDWDDQDSGHFEERSEGNLDRREGCCRPS